MLKKIFLSVSRSGVNENQSIIFADKLIVRNHLALICAFFSSIYLVYFFKNGFVFGSVCISTSILLFILSIVFNYFQYFSISKAIIVLVTNFSVLFTSILFGFNSGFHLYLLTAPLITFMLFEPKQRLVIFLSILSYCANFFALIILYKHNHYESHIIHNEQSSHMYLLNFTFTIFIIITLLLYYSYNNLKVNSLLVAQNETLGIQKQNLKYEVDIRRKAEEELVLLLADKNLLIGEINHRVKNNLAVISGFLELENIYAADEAIGKVIKDNKNRIKAIALLHEQLYQEKNTGLINVNEYLKHFEQNIKNTYTLQSKDLKFIYDIDEIELTMDFALPLALIINELVVDSIKNVNQLSKNGIINVSIKNQNNKVNVYYKDNLMREEQNLKNHNKTYTFDLIEAFTSQLNGVSVFDLNDGIRFTLTF